MPAAMLSAPLSASRAVPAQLKTAAGRSRVSSIRRAPARAAARPAVCFVETQQEGEKRTEGAKLIEVTFSVVRQVPFGHQLLVVGNCPELGGWQVSKAPLMSWSEGNVWRATLELQAGTKLEYKFVQQVPNQPAVWEGCGNRLLTLGDSDSDYSCEWNAPLSTKAAPPSKQAAAAAALTDDDVSATEEDAPAPAFKPASALASFADAVKQSLSPSAPAAEQDKPKDKPAPAAPTAAATKAPGANAVVPTPASLTTGAISAANGASKAKAVLEAAAAEVLPPTEQPKVVEPKAAAQAAADAKAAAEQADFYKPAAASSSALAPSAAVEAKAEVVPAKQPTPAKPTTPGSTMKSIGKAAGAVAMTVAAGAVLSALAIDVTDVAMMGALTVGGMAAMNTASPTTGSTSSSSSKRGDKAATKATGSGEAESEEGAAAAADDEEAEGEGKADKEVMIGNKASAPAVILAASVLTAMDAGKGVVKALGEEGSSGTQKKAKGGKKGKKL